MSDQAGAIAAVSWVLELPRDLGLPDDTFSSTGVAGDVPPGWKGKLGELPEWPGCEFQGIPRRRLRFRRAYVGIGMPTEATDRTFSDLKRLKGLKKLRHAMGLRRLSRRGVKEWKTVCQMTKWYAGDELDAVNEWSDSKTPLERGFMEMLADLDLWLQAYGLVSGELEIGSIALHDLPSAVPWTIHYKQSPDAPEFAFTGLLPIHDRVPNMLPGRGNQEAAKEAGIIVATNAETAPAFTAFTLLFQAQASAVAGRGRQATIDAGTAVESLVALVIKEALRAEGASDTDIADTLSQRWPTVFNRELLKALGISSGEGGAEHAKWWRVHYKRRNDAVHSGATPSKDAALEMVSDTWDLFDWIERKARVHASLSMPGKSITVMKKRP
jgi:hypothetical protein